MFGDPIGNILKSTSKEKKLSADDVKLFEAVLDYIRANLLNIRRTWGPDSPQYKSAAKVMDEYLEQNMRRINVEKPDLENLMQQMTLDDFKS